MWDLTRYRMKTVQARTSEIQRLAKALESAGIKLGSVASSITGVSATAMIQALIDGERRGGVQADLAIGRMRTAGKLADLSMALAGWFTEHHALLCRLHLDRIAVFDDAVGGLDTRIGGKAARWQRDGPAHLRPGLRRRGGAGRGWARSAPHRHFATHEKLACWVTLCPGNNISARKRKHGRTGDAGTYIKPMLIQAASNAIRVRGRLQARYNRLVRRFGGDKNPAAKKKAITAIAHTLLKIAYPVLKTGTPYQDLGADFYTRRESPEQKQAWLERQLLKLHPGCTITITISPTEAALTPGAWHKPRLPAPEPPPTRHPATPAGQIRATSHLLPLLRPRFAAARPPGTQLSCQSATASQRQRLSQRALPGRRSRSLGCPAHRPRPPPRSRTRPGSRTITRPEVSSRDSENRRHHHDQRPDRPHRPARTRSERLGSVLAARADPGPQHRHHRDDPGRHRHRTRPGRGAPALGPTSKAGPENSA